MWLFRHKHLADGTFSRYKARLVANDIIRDLFMVLSMPLRLGFNDLGHITRVGFTHSRCGSSLFIYRNGTDTAYLQLYVNDIVLTLSSEHKYAAKILERAYIFGYNPCRTLVDTESKLRAYGDPVSHPTLYHSLAGALQYLTFTHPNISYTVQQVCHYMNDPREFYFLVVKRILCYVRDTLDNGLQLYSSSITSLVAYSDADWDGFPTTRRSTSVYFVFLGNNLLFWSSKRQQMLFRSSAEAEYHGVANAVIETCWLRNLLRELHTPLPFDTLVYYENASVVYLSYNPVQDQRTKHIEIDIHFVRDLVDDGHVWVFYVHSRYPYADIFTKSLPLALFEEFCTIFSIRCPPAPVTEEC
nr:ribonuclease H-like domain-containing protein [Tanacetum cinerariifolium]